MCFKNTLTILKALIVIILLAFYYRFFFKDVMANYREGLTNMATTEREFEKDESGIKAPSFILCFATAFKKNVLDTNNITDDFFILQDGKYEHLLGKKTMKELIIESSLILNRDVEVAINRLPPQIHGNSNLKLQIGYNLYQINEDQFFFNVTEVYSVQ